jgi:hypothetical protein
VCQLRFRVRMGSGGSPNAAKKGNTSGPLLFSVVPVVSAGRTAFTATRVCKYSCCFLRCASSLPACNKCFSVASCVNKCFQLHRASTSAFSCIVRQQVLFSCIVRQQVLSVASCVNKCFSVASCVNKCFSVASCVNQCFSVAVLTAAPTANQWTGYHWRLFR